MATTTLERIAKTENSLDKLESIVQKLAVSVGELRENQKQSSIDQQKGFAELRESQKQGATELRENQKQGFAELRKSQKQLNKQLGELSKRLGTIVEDLVAPSLERIFFEVADLPDDSETLVHVRVKRRHSKTREVREFDAIVESKKYLLVNETKSQLKPEDIPKFLTALAEFYSYFSEYKDKELTIIGAMSSLHLDESLTKALSRQGLLALAISDTITTIKSPEDFVWKAF